MFFFWRERDLLICRFKVFGRGQYPNLKQVHRFRFRRIEFTVHNAAAGGHHLNLVWPKYMLFAHAIAVQQLSLEHVRKNLHVAVRVRTEALAGRYRVLVDDSQRAKTHVGGIAIVRKREREIRIVPASVEVFSFIRFSNLNHNEDKTIGFL
jgi:hypothetical protein